MSLKALRTLSKIEDICRFLAGVNDDFDVPDWVGVLDEVLDGLHTPHALMEISLKFG